MKRPSDQTSKNISSIVDRIRPSVEPFRSTEIWNDHDALVHASTRSNVIASVNQLRHGSSILENLIDKKDLVIIGAEYSLETGEVEFYED